MSNLIKSIISFWLNSILVLAILVIFFYATSLQFLRLQLPFGSDLLQQQAESTLNTRLILAIIGIIICVVMMIIVRRALSSKIGFSSLFLNIVFVYYVIDYLNGSGLRSNGSIIPSLSDYAPFIISLCLSVMILIINQLIFINRIPIKDFLKRFFISYIPLSLSTLLILSYLILFKDIDKFSRAWDNNMLTGNYLGSYTNLECTLLAEIKEGIGPNYNKKIMEPYSNLFEYTNDDEPYNIDVMLDTKEFRGRNLITKLFVLYEPYDATRYEFKPRYANNNYLARPEDYKFFRAETDKVFDFGPTDKRLNYELVYDIEKQEIRVKQENVIVKINKDTYKIDDWELKFYEANLGKITHMTLQELKCKNK